MQIPPIEPLICICMDKPAIDRAQTLFFILDNPRVALQGSNQSVLAKLLWLAAFLQLPHEIS